MQPKEDFDRGYFVHVLADNFGSGLSNFFPLYLHTDGTSLLEVAGRKPNLTEGAAVYVTKLGVGPEELFYHTLAVLHAPAYRSENAGALRQDWPRVPLPDLRETLQASAVLGRQVAALLDVDTQIPGVTVGQIRNELREMAVFVRVDGNQAQPDAGDLDITVGWGHAGKSNVTMPGQGKIADHGNHLDVYLNDVACWRNLPKAVWDYTIGGYQVVKKWLSYREKALLGRGLTPDEVRYVTEMARRIAGLVDLRPMLDANYRSIIQATYLSAAK